MQDTDYQEPEQGMTDIQGAAFSLIRGHALQIDFNGQGQFGFNPRNENVIETHADMLVNILLGNAT